MTLMENVSKVVVALNSIKNAIIEKGVTPTGDCTTYAQAIAQIPSGSDVKCAIEVIVTPTADPVTVECGFKPKHIFICADNNGNFSTWGNAYEERVSDSKQMRWANATPSTVPIGYNNAYSIMSISDTGFTYRGYPGRNWIWFAIG